jgi:hypothetical protein
LSLAYVPGLKRREAYLVTKVRRLPIPGEVLVSKGDRVSQDTVVASADIPGRLFVVDAYRDLLLTDQLIDRFTLKPETNLLKREGDSVRKGEVLAIRRALGFFERTCLSPCDGTVDGVNIYQEGPVHRYAEIRVREPPLKLNVDAYIPGIVSRVLPKEGAVIQTVAAFIQGSFGVGGETSGELALPAKSSEDILEAEQIGLEHAGKVMVGRASVELEALRRAVDVGVRAIVVGSVRDNDVTRFLGRQTDVVTGQEEGLTLVVTEGFGRVRMLKRTYELLRRFEGSTAFVDGTTQMRAGVIRPEVIIPREEIDQTPCGRFAESNKAYTDEMGRGALVRIVHQPYLGALGKVVEIPLGLKRLETEVLTSVLWLELDDGRRVVVPKSNVELVEE